MTTETTATKTATFVKDVSHKFAGTAHLYRVEPSGQSEGVEYDYVVSSGVHVTFEGAETYLFPADAEGNVLDWMELPGSFKGDIDPEAAVRNAGYEIN